MIGGVAGAGDTTVFSLVVRMTKGKGPQPNRRRLVSLAFTPNALYASA